MNRGKESIIIYKNKAFDQQEKTCILKIYQIVYINKVKI